MKTKLNQIASIQTGIFARTVPEGDIVYLQAKHFDENGLLGSTLHADLNADTAIQKHLLKPGDVLFAAKGYKNFATVYESHNHPAVASTTFFVIKVKTESVLPEYLSWVLNSSVIQNFLKRNASGSSIVSISKALLEELEISVPDLLTQKKILEISKLRMTERSLKQQIESLRETQIQQQIIIALKQ